MHDDSTKPRAQQTCFISGCTKKVLAKGMCSCHYERQRSGRELYAPDARFLDEAERWRLRKKEANENGCIVWKAGCDSDGYGVFSHHGKHYRAHRYAWIQANGPIPDGLFVCHKCDNPPCINVEHLFLGGAKENSDDMVAKGRAAKQAGSLHNRAKMTEEHVTIFRQSVEPSAVLAKRYGVSIAMVSSARRGESWRHVSTPVMSEEMLRQIAHEGKCRGDRHPRARAAKAARELAKHDLVVVETLVTREVREALQELEGTVHLGANRVLSEWFQKRLLELLAMTREERT